MARELCDRTTWYENVCLRFFLVSSVYLAIYSPDCGVKPVGMVSPPGRILAISNLRRAKLPALNQSLLDLEHVVNSDGSQGTTKLEAHDATLRWWSLGGLNDGLDTVTS